MGEGGDRMRGGRGLPAIVRNAVRAARLTRRGAGLEARRRMLTLWQVERLREFLAGADPACVAVIVALLRSLDGPARAVSRALVLRAVVAHIAVLSESRGALARLGRFAARLRGHSREDLLRCATVLDLDSRTSRTRTDALALYENRGRVRPVRGETGARDDDGLIQRFTAACGPTVVQMIVAENDPLLAFAIHRAGVHSARTDDLAARFQRHLLASFGVPAVGRVEVHLRARLRNALGRLVLAGRLSPSAAQAAREHAEGGAPLGPVAVRALAVVRERYDGFPSERDVARLRRAGPLPPQSDGWSIETFATALERFVRPVTGLSYRPSGFGRGQAWRHLDTVTRALWLGAEVPFGIAEPAHYMLLSDVRGRAPQRWFLVSDPDAGRTAWVAEAEFRSGRFIDRQFHLCTVHDRGYVDSFFVPNVPPVQV
jgi:hypothetical protein